MGGRGSRSSKKYEDASTHGRYASKGGTEFADNPAKGIPNVIVPLAAIEFTLPSNHSSTHDVAVIEKMTEVGAHHHGIALDTLHRVEEGLTQLSDRPVPASPGTSADRQL